MNIKSLLLGSAVASVAFTGAPAADAIFVPEPEPMEYVRVCDVYGAGFFYIPGTETCLKVGGYVRYQINWNEGDDGWRKQSRAQLTLDARNETELGTLRSFAELWFQNDTPNNGGNDDGLRVRQAFIELGGLFLGTKITLWDGALDGEYDNFGADAEVHTVGYNFAAANGVNVALALEEYRNNDDYTPNVVGKVGISQGWGSLNVFAAYDADAEEWAAKALANVKLADPLTLQLAAAYSSGNTRYAPSLGTIGTSFNNGLFGPFRQTTSFSDTKYYEWTVGAHLKYAVNNKLTLGIGGQYFADAHDRTYSNPYFFTWNSQGRTRTVGGQNDWAVGAVVDYKIVKGFDAKLAVNYKDGDSYTDGGKWDGFLRLTRSF